MSFGGILKSVVNKENNSSLNWKNKADEKSECTQPLKVTSENAFHANRLALQSKENVKKEKLRHKHKQQSIKRFVSENVSTEVKKKLKVFDETVTKQTKATSTQTADDVVTMLCSDEPNERYWELLAEERRKALQAALEENKQLADEIEEKDQLIEELKLDVERLEETASHVQYLASVVQQLTQDDGEEENEQASTSNTVLDDLPQTETGDKSLNTTDGNDQFNGKSAVLSDGSCSHDSDKENKRPVFGLIFQADSSD